MAMLGISMNTRLLGRVVIKNGKLVEYAVRLHKSPWSSSKADKIIQSLEPCVRQYCIKSIVLSIPHAYHQTPEFRTLIARLKKHFKSKGVPVHTRSVTEIYALCPEQQRKTKQRLMTVLCGIFPYLSYCRDKELSNKSRYYVKVFEAAGAVLLHSQNG